MRTHGAVGLAGDPFRVRLPGLAIGGVVIHARGDDESHAPAAFHEVPERIGVAQPFVAFVIWNLSGIEGDDAAGVPTGGIHVGPFQIVQPEIEIHFARIVLHQVHGQPAHGAPVPVRGRDVLERVGTGGLGRTRAHSRGGGQPIPASHLRNRLPGEDGDEVEHRFAGEDASDVGCIPGSLAVQALGRAGGDVRGHHHIGHREQGVIRGRRLLRENIQPSAGKIPAVQGRDQRWFVHYFAARGVDEDRTLAHHRDARRAQQSAGRRRQGDVQADAVARGEQGFQRHAGESRGLDRVGVLHLHSERESPPGHSLPDAPEPNQAQRLSIQAEGLQAAVPHQPASGAQRLVEFHQAAAHGEHEEQGVFGDLVGISADREGHGDGAFRRSLEVDAVIADAGRLDQAEAPRPRHHLAGHFGCDQEFQFAQDAGGFREGVQLAPGRKGLANDGIHSRIGLEKVADLDAH